MAHSIIKNAHYIGPDRRCGERRLHAQTNPQKNVQHIERRKGRDRRARCAALDQGWKAY